MFENFTKPPDTSENLLGKVAMTAIVLMFIGIPALYIFRTTFAGNEPVPDGFSMSSEAATERVKNLCASLPMPEKVELITKGTPYDSPESTLVYYQFSSTRSREEIMPAYLFWFGENGWKYVADTDSTFQKGKQSIYIWNVPGYYGDESIYFDIYCSEKK